MQIASRVIDTEDEPVGLVLEVAFVASVSIILHDFQSVKCEMIYLLTVRLIKDMVSNTCDESDPKIITIDNTYWLSPSMGIGSSTSSCSVTVKLNAKLPEQGKAVCQVR